MAVRYRFAVDAAGSLADVATLTPATRTARGPYACVGCGRPLVARVGAGRAAHFAHRARETADACGPETYLHQLAKRAFADAYRARVAAERPYLLPRTVARTCRHYRAAYGLVCAYPVEEAYDLTRYFDRIEVEAPVGALPVATVGTPPAEALPVTPPAAPGLVEPPSDAGQGGSAVGEPDWATDASVPDAPVAANAAVFRADVLLRSSRHPGRQLLIEFAVTHRCTPEKRASGLRIVELVVRSEADVVRWAHGIAADQPGVTLLNFADNAEARELGGAGEGEDGNVDVGAATRSRLGRRRPGAADVSRCAGRCDRATVDVFVAYRSGKSVLLQLPPDEVAAHRIWRTAAHVEVIGPSSVGLGVVQERYRDRVRAAHFAGVPVRNCFVCRYHGTGGLEAAVFCRVRREPVSSNEAATCEAYRPFGTPEVCAAADEANARRGEAYWRARVARRVAGI